MEELYPIPGFPNHLITKNGDVYSIKYRRFRKPVTTSDGYLRMKMSYGDKNDVHSWAIARQVSSS